MNGWSKLGVARWAWLGGLALTFDVALAQQWTTHQNGRFGFTFEYPSDLFKFDRASKGGEGEMFFAPSLDARLIVGAVENTHRHTAASYQAFTERNSYRNDRVTYRKRGSTWFVLSGYRGDKIFYEKVIFSCGGRLLNGFALTYPARHGRRVSQVIEHIEDTFRPAPGSCP